MERRDFLKIGLVAGSASLLPNFTLGKQQKDWIKVQLSSWWLDNMNFVSVNGKDGSKRTIPIYDRKNIGEDKVKFITDYDFKYEIWSGNYAALVSSRLGLFRSGLPLKHFTYCPMRSGIITGKMNFFFAREGSMSIICNTFGILPKNIFDNLNGKTYTGFDCIYKKYNSEEEAIIDLRQAQRSM